VLDAGHGGNDRGASHFGVREKDVNLDLVKRLALRLENQGITVILTRRQDVFLPLPERSSIANQYPQAIFVSIHCNASTNNPAATGVETFVLSRQADNAARQARAGKRYQVTGGDQALATLLARSRERAPALAQALQNTLATRLGVPNRGVKQADLAVLRETFFCPAILVEVGFISNATTANQMASAAWRGLAAEALAEGIVDYLRKS
jgi:N-acetylmuramoyl-L-alanine amidase